MKNILVQAEATTIIASEATVAQALTELQGKGKINTIDVHKSYTRTRLKRKITPAPQKSYLIEISICCSGKLRELFEEKKNTKIIIIQ